MSTRRAKMSVQLPLFSTSESYSDQVPFPSTRYQGSKRKLVGWIWENVKDLSFDTVLDVFGGTGAVSHLLKNANKQVTYNDNLTFNWNIGLALIQNANVTLSVEDTKLILKMHSKIDYPDFIQRTFPNIYFTDEENIWLDHITYNIDHFLDNPFKQALARFALFQACIIKRPYNLFHRANLYMRQAKVDRSFGNKSTWDTSFDIHFQAFVQEANKAVFDNGRQNQAVNLEALSTPLGNDLVYIDPPYISAKGVGVDYRDFYHFLEGLTCYDNWNSFIDLRSRHKRLAPVTSAWTQPKNILSAFEQLISRHRNSILVVSYRDNGIPSKVELLELLRDYKQNVWEVSLAQKYVLSIQDSHELLFIAQ